MGTPQRTSGHLAGTGGWCAAWRPGAGEGVDADMVRKTVHARGGKSSDVVDEAVRKARAEAGVELILVVYEDQAAHVYVEKDRPVRKAAARDA